MSAERVHSLGAHNLEGNHDVSSTYLSSSKLTEYGAARPDITTRDGLQSSDRFGRWDAAPTGHPDDSDYEDRRYGRRHRRVQGGSSDRDGGRERPRDTSGDSHTRHEIRFSEDSRRLGDDERRRSDEKDGGLDRRRFRKVRDDGPDGDGSEGENSDSLQSPRREVRHRMKPPTFDGKQSLDSFLAQFEVCAGYNRWTEGDKAAFLKCALVGQTAQLLWDAGDPQKLDYAELIERLRARYGSSGQAEKFRTELRARKRRRGESLNELYNDIRRLMALAYPVSIESTVRDVIARDHFIAAMGDRDFELKLREREPTDLDEALRVAIRLEAYASAYVNEPSYETRPTRSRFEPDEGENRLNRRMAQMEKTVRQLTSGISRDFEKERDSEWRTKYDQLAKDYDRLKLLQERRTARETGESTSSTPQQTDRNGERQRGAVKCYGCGELGHFRRNCRKSASRENKTASNESQRDGEQSGPTNRKATSDAPQDDDREAYLRVRIQGKPTDCLLDTGSEVTLIPEFLRCRTQLQPYGHTLKAANGTVIPVLGQCTLMGCIDTHMLEINGVVTKHVPNVILGVGWLKAHRAVWDFAAGSIQLDGYCYKLHSRPVAGWCRRILVQDPVDVPPMSELIVNTFVECRDVSHSAGCTEDVWTTEAGEPVYGLRVSRTAVPDRLTNVPVRVMNITARPISLAEGKVVTVLQPAEMISAADPSPKCSLQEEQILRGLVDKIDETVSAEAREKLLQLLLDYRGAFSFSDADLGRANIVRHAIDTGDAQPVRQPLRRQPPAHQTAIREHVQVMLGQGIIEPAQSPWASNLVLVKKKDGSLRCCVDYRQLNFVSKKDAYPLPRTDTCLDAMTGASWFTTLDLRSSYHQVELEHRDRDKTTFICREGAFRFITMPFGLCNAGATLQRLMDVIMTGINFEACLVYLDDIVVFSSTVDQHLERLQQVLERLRKTGLRLKPEKCDFLKQSVEFLGHMVSSHGIGVHPSKIAAVTEWPVPCTLREVRSFLGLCGYYRRFVRGFSDIAAPLYRLTEKGRAFLWTEECQIAFDRLKAHLTSAPVLCMPDDDRPYVLDTDASDFAIGAVLSQNFGGEERVVAYASKRLTRTEANYCVTRRELLAVVYFIKYFRHYLLGRQSFLVRTDHAALQWLRRIPEPVGQQARWLETLEEYNFTVVHRSGVHHSNADAMSRRPCDRQRCCPRSTATDGSSVSPSNEEDETVIQHPAVQAVGHDTVATHRNASSAPHDDTRQSDTTERDAPAPQSHLNDGTDFTSNTDTSWVDMSLAGLQASDADIGPVYAVLSSGGVRPTLDDIACLSEDSKTLFRQWDRLCIRNELLYRRFEPVNGQEPFWQIILPRCKRLELIDLVHAGTMGGHFGRKRTQACVQARAYWPGWTNNVRDYLRRCVPCNRYHRGAAPRAAALKPFQAGETWETVSIDITGPHPRSSRGYVFIVTLVDHFSKWGEAVPLRNHTAPVVAKALFDHVFCRFGMPRRILTDQGAEFESTLFQEFCRLMDIEKVRTTPYRPSTNGVVERFHRTLNAIIAKLVNEDQRNWCVILPTVLAAYRATPHESTGFSPNRVMFGKENCMPADLVIGQRPSDDTCRDSIDDYVFDLCDRLHKSHQLVRKNLGHAAEFRKKRYDVSVKSNDLSVGTWVWYLCPRRRVSLSPKWQSYYTGPYLVVKVIDSHCIAIQRSRKSKVFVVHRDKLKKCFSETPNSWLESQSSGKQSQSAVVPSSPSAVGDPQQAIDAGIAPAPAPQRFRRRRRQRRPNRDLSTVEPTTRHPRRTTKPSYLNDYVCSVSIDRLVPDQKNSMAESQLSNALTCRACKQTFERRFCLHRHLRTASLADKHRRFYKDRSNAERLYYETSLRWYDIRKESLIDRSRNPTGVFAVVREHYDKPEDIVRQFHGADGRNRLEAAVHAVLTDPQSVNLQQAIESFQLADLGLTVHEAEVAAIAAFAAAQLASDIAVDAGQIRKLERPSLCLNKRLHHLDGLLYKWCQGCPDATVVQGTRDYTVKRETATWCTADGQSNMEQPACSGKAVGRRRRRHRQRTRRCTTKTCGGDETDSDVVVVTAPGESSADEQCDQTILKPSRDYSSGCRQALRDAVRRKADARTSARTVSSIRVKMLTVAEPFSSEVELSSSGTSIQSSTPIAVPVFNDVRESSTVIETVAHPTPEDLTVLDQATVPTHGTATSVVNPHEPREATDITSVDGGSVSGALQEILQDIQAPSTGAHGLQQVPSTVSSAGNIEASATTARRIVIRRPSLNGDELLRLPIVKSRRWSSQSLSTLD
jgi:hypothetical protein